MKRGSLVPAVLPGDYDKPRPALVVQSDAAANLMSVLICPLTSDVQTSGPFRVLIESSEQNGLRKTSLVMIDKLTVISRLKCGLAMGHLTPTQMQAVNEKLTFVLGLAD